MSSKSWLVVCGFGVLLLWAVASTSQHSTADARPSPTYAAPTYTPPPVQASAPAATTYTVQPGDGWYAIAQANGTTLHALLLANNAPSTDVPLYPNEVLNLPSTS